MRNFSIDLDNNLSKTLIIKNLIFTATKYFTCVIVAVPTAVLNGLAALYAHSHEATSLKSITDLNHLLHQATPAELSYGVIALLSSESVLYFLNQRYLFASLQLSLDLLKRTILTLRNLCYCQNYQKSDFNLKNRARLTENILFIWSILTSLIFAAMGGKALSFLGEYGEIIGFTLSLFVYFATRFASAKIFLDNASNFDYRQKQYYLKKLELLDQHKININVNNVNNVNLELKNFLEQIDSQWATLPKDKKRVVLLNYLAPVLGWLLVIITILPILSGFLPSSIQGLELLTGLNIGSNDHYQNIQSFVIGFLATTLTLFFYELNIQNLPEQFFRTMLSLHDKTLEKNYREIIKLSILTLLALCASYLTSIGFKLIVTEALSEGNLSYLGNVLSHWIPDGVLIGVTAMLWSHLQGLINQHISKSNIDLEQYQPTEIDLSAATILLRSNQKLFFMNNSNNPTASLKESINAHNAQSQNNFK